MKDSAILIRLEAAEHERLLDVARADGRPLAQWARRAIMAACFEAGKAAMTPTVDDAPPHGPKFANVLPTPKRKAKPKPKPKRKARRR